MASEISNHKSQISVKVCGLTKLNQINELIKLNVDFLGFIFYQKSPRFVLDKLSLEEIKNINHIGKVGVFVNENIENINYISEKCGLNYIQLHGDENEDFIIKLRESLAVEIKIIKVIRVGNHKIEMLQKTINQQPTNINYFLFDTDSSAFGGTGKSFDWQILNDLKIEKPYFLSGGISEENYEKFKNLNLKPFALDINSKFEIEPGNKDIEKIKSFIGSL